MGSIWCLRTLGVLDQMEFSGTVRILSQCSCFSRFRCVMLACTWQMFRPSPERRPHGNMQVTSCGTQHHGTLCLDTMPSGLAAYAQSR